jgi:hypothetical protein
MKMNIIIGIIFIVVFSVTIAVYLYQKPVDRVVSDEADFEVTAVELFTAFDENEASANEKYVNKVITVRGVIEDISASDSLGLNIILASGSPMFGVSCQLPDVDESIPLKAGGEVTITGLCTGKLMDVVLVRCRIEI